MAAENATCARCACVIDPPEPVPDDGEETFCDYCTMEIDLEYERENRLQAEHEARRTRKALIAIRDCGATAESRTAYDIAVHALDSTHGEDPPL